MSVSSVRSAVTAALADKKVTLDEAQKITGIAGRTGGISPAERAEMSKVFRPTNSFESGAKAHLAASAAAPTTASTPVDKALRQLINSKGADFIDGLDSIESDQLSPELMASLEKFAEVLNYNDADTISWSAKKLTVSGQDLVVVNDYDGEKELIAVFTKQGVELARTSLQGKDSGVAMRWESLSGGHAGSPIGTPNAVNTVTLPANFKTELDAWIEQRASDGESYGTDVDKATIPAPVRRQYEIMERNIADGTGLEKFKFKGVEIYALRDFSCVTSSYFHTADGKRVTDYCEG